ncbi:MAG: flagellar M-ring protein FliF, partial [Pseudomonadota bacterium]
MSQLATIWSNLDARRQITVVVATLAAFAAVYFGARIAATPDMALLYAGLDNATAGEVIANLEQRNVPYEVRNGAIFVPRAERDKNRLTLAASGLPASGSAGYELLDDLSGFGTTSQMFDAAYWRAKEGELARTITTSPAVRS